MLATPLVFLWTLGTILELEVAGWTRAGLLFLLSISLNGTVMMGYDERMMVLSPPGL